MDFICDFSVSGNQIEELRITLTTGLIIYLYLDFIYTVLKSSSQWKN